MFMFMFLINGSKCDNYVFLSLKQLLWSDKSVVNINFTEVLTKSIEVLEIDETPTYGMETKLKIGINGIVECKKV